MSDETKHGVIQQPGREAVSALTKLAAECHCAKWQFDFNDENRLPVGKARDMVRRAFQELHRIGDLALEAKAALAPQPALEPDEDRMEKISALIARLQSTMDQWGDTCVYIRRGGLSWGAVALNRRADDQKHGVFDLQAQHDRDMLERLEQIGRLKASRDDAEKKLAALAAPESPALDPATVEALAKAIDPKAFEPSHKEISEDKYAGGEMYHHIALARREEALKAADRIRALLASPAPSGEPDLALSKYGEPAIETAIKAIVAWQANKATTFTPANILTDFGDAILAKLRAPSNASEVMTPLQKRMNSGGPFGGEDVAVASASNAEAVPSSYTPPFKISGSCIWDARDNYVAELSAVHGPEQRDKMLAFLVNAANADCASKPDSSTDQVNPICLVCNRNLSEHSLDTADICNSFIGGDR